MFLFLVKSANLKNWLISRNNKDAGFDCGKSPSLHSWAAWPHSVLATVQNDRRWHAAYRFEGRKVRHFLNNSNTLSGSSWNTHGLWLLTGQSQTKPRHPPDFAPQNGSADLEHLWSAVLTLMASRHPCSSASTVTMSSMHPAHRESARFVLSDWKGEDFVLTNRFTLVFGSTG